MLNNPTDFTAPLPPEIYDLIGADEKIIWSGKPHKKCFLLEAIFNPLLPFALVWALFDGFCIMMLTTTHKEQASGMPPLIVFGAFFALHLMPVWIYLCGVFFSFLTHKHTAYVITDKAIYTSGGMFSVNYVRKPFSEISSISIHRGIVDQWLNVGDVEMKENEPANLTDNHLPETLQRLQTQFAYKRNARIKPFTLCDLPDYQEVYNLIRELQNAVQTPKTEN